MKTSNEKYRRSHWWKFTDWESVGLIALLVAIVGFAVFSLGWVIFRSDSNDSNKADSIADTIAVMDSVQAKPDTADFDTVISGTRIVIKANRPVKVVVK